MLKNEQLEFSKIHAVANKLLLHIEVGIKASNRKEFSDEDLLKLHSIFGPVLERAFNVFEKYPTLEAYSTASARQLLIEVKGDNNRCYRIFPRINYCSCLAFKHQVVGAKSQATCKHVLAARIALMLGKTVNRDVTLDQYQMLLRSMFDFQA